MAAVSNSLHRVTHRDRRWIALIALLLCVTINPFSVAAAQEGRGPALPNGDGKELVASACSQCHGLRETTNLRESQKAWEEVVDRMVLYGAQLSPSEAERISRYLGTELGPGTTLMAGEANSPHGRMNISLPPGHGQTLVAARCALCHDLGRIVGVPRPRTDWEPITTSMLQGLSDTPDEVQSMIVYLQANFSTTSAVGAHAQRALRVQSATPAQTIPQPQTADIYAQKCLLCHSTERGKDRLGPSLFGEMSGPHPKKTEQEVRSIVRDGKGKMPAFKDILSDEDTDKLLEYVRSL